MKQYRHRRSSNPANPFPSPLQPGEISVNTANRQLAAGDAAAGTIGVPLPLIAVRYFDARGQYAVGDHVVQAGKLYRCTTAHAPAAFDPAHFTEIGTGGGGSGGGATLVTSTTPPTPAVDNTLWWDSENGLLYLRYNDGNSSQWVLASPIGGSGGSGSGAFLPLTGGALTGAFQIWDAPSLPIEISDSKYDWGVWTDNTGYVETYQMGTTPVGTAISFYGQSGTLAAPAASQQNDVLGALSFLGVDAGTNAQLAASMRVIVDGMASNGAVPGGFSFSTGLGGERFAIQSDGIIRASTPFHANGPLLANSWFYNKSNIGNVNPTLNPATGGFALGWNYSAGQGEINLVSTYAGNTGFWFQHWDGSAMATWAKLDINGLDIKNGIHLRGSTPYMPQLQIDSSTPDATAGYLLLSKSRNGVGVMVGDMLGSIVWTGATADGVSRNSPTITSNVLARGTDWVSADLAINTIDTAGNYSPRVNIRGDSVSITPPLLTESYARIAGGVIIGAPMTGTDPRYKLTDTDNATYANYFGPNFIAIDSYNNGVQTPILSFDYARGTLTASTAVQQNDALGTITWSAQSGPNPATDWITVGQIHAVVDSPVTVGSIPIAYNFLSNGNSNLFIASDGRLTVRADPVNPMQLATKRYVDNYAAPLDALAYNGMQINAGMEVKQSKGVFATSVNDEICDCWRPGHIGTMAVVYTAPISPFWGFVAFINVAVTTAQPTMTAPDVCVFLQPIEGARISRLAWSQGGTAKPVTISFMSAHHRPGVYSLSIRNGSSTRSYVTTYTQANADTWQFNTVTIPGCPDGTWATDNTVGMYLTFCVASGTTNTAPSANTWLTGNYVAAPGQVNGVATTADVTRISAVVILPGTQAPTIATLPNLLRPFNTELTLCQRYSWFSNYETPNGATVGTLMGYSLAANSLQLGSWRFPVPMRAVPALSLWQNGVFGKVRDSTSGAVITVGNVGNTYFSRSGGSIMLVDSIAAGVWADFDLWADARLF